jgi:hypothetical protein
MENGVEACITHFNLPVWMTVLFYKMQKSLWMRQVTCTEGMLVVLVIFHASSRSV